MDDRNKCLREAFSHYGDEHYFRFCRRFGCPDAERMAQYQADRRQDFTTPDLSCPPFDFMTAHITSVPQRAPTCVVNIFMLKLISTVMGHVFALRKLLKEPGNSTTITSVTCEHFLHRGWQGKFLRTYCQPAHVVGESQGNLIGLDGEVPPPASLTQTYRLTVPVSKEVVPDHKDSNLSTLYDSTIVFTQEFLGSLQGQTINQ